MLIQQNMLLLKKRDEMLCLYFSGYLKSVKTLERVLFLKNRKTNLKSV